MVSGVISVHREAMKRALQIRPGLGVALHVVQEGGLPLWRVFVEFPTLILVCAGMKRLRLDGQEIVAQEGEMIALPGGNEVEVTNSLPAVGPYRAQSLSIDPALCLECERPGTRSTLISGARLVADPPDFLRGAFARALAACDQSSALPTPIARHHVQEVLLGLAEHGLSFDLRALSKIATRVRRLVGSDAARRWRAGNVAQQLGM